MIKILATKIEDGESIQTGDNIMILSKDGLAYYENVFVKITFTDGVEIILKRKGNIYFNLDMYLKGESWVIDCIKISKGDS